MSLSAIPNNFNPGVTPTVFLPVDGREALFVASIQAGLSGSLPIERCFDKYGILWKWSTFELSAIAPGLSAIPGLSSTRTPLPLFMGYGWLLRSIWKSRIRVKLYKFNTGRFS
jgi:hypothetical protein